MTHLEYLQQNALSTREFEGGKFAIYCLIEGIATYNHHNHKYLWYRRPDTISADKMREMITQ